MLFFYLYLALHLLIQNFPHQGFYRTKVSVPPGHLAGLFFEACSIFCRVYIDGVVVAENTRGGFTPFWVNVPPATSRSRSIVVMASNVFDPILTPTQAANYDFYQ